jgi:hypothetical protein
MLVAIYQYRLYPPGRQLALESFSEHHVWQFRWLEHVALPVLIATLTVSRWKVQSIHVRGVNRRNVPAWGMRLVHEDDVA